jgi:hypothetical protein
MRFPVVSQDYLDDQSNQMRALLAIIVAISILAICVIQLTGIHINRPIVVNMFAIICVEGNAPISEIDNGSMLGFDIVHVYSDGVDSPIHLDNNRVNITNRLREGLNEVLQQPGSLPYLRQNFVYKVNDILPEGKWVPVTPRLIQEVTGLVVPHTVAQKLVTAHAGRKIPVAWYNLQWGLFFGVALYPGCKAHDKLTLLFDTLNAKLAMQKLDGINAVVGKGKRIFLQVLYTVIVGLIAKFVF